MIILKTFETFFVYLRRNIKTINLENYKINGLIKAKEVRLVGLPDNYTNGIYPINEAIKIAEEIGEDLIEISSNASPVVCKVMEFSKFLYEIKKKEKDNKKNQKNSLVKEMSLSPNIGDHDLETKVRKSREFLEDGNKVKVVMLFKGRAIVFKEQGEIIMLKFASLLDEVGSPETMPKMEGKKMQFIIKPKPKAK